jgi:hypothetical protein
MVVWPLAVILAIANMASPVRTALLSYFTASIRQDQVELAVMVRHGRMVQQN